MKGLTQKFFFTFVYLFIMATGLYTADPTAITACTGYPLHVLLLYCEEFHLVANEGRNLVAALTIAHTDCSNEQLVVYYCGLFFEVVPSSTLFERSVRVLKKIFHQPMKHRCNERFNVVDPILGNISCILDGTAVNVRLHAKEFGFKGKCANFQVLTTLDAELMTYSGPWTGRLNDARNFCQDDDHERTKHCPLDLITELTFEHGEDEAIAADGAYKASLHCIVPYETEKLTEAEFNALPAATKRVIREQQLWNQVFAYRRSRIERRFGQLDRHRMFHFTLRSIPMIALLFRAMWNAEIIQLQATSARHKYSDELFSFHAVPRSLGGPCTCAFQGMWYADHAKRLQFNQHRDDLRRAYVSKYGMSVRMPKPSGHESKADKEDRLMDMSLLEVLGYTERRLFY